MSLLQACEPFLCVVRKDKGYKLVSSVSFPKSVYGGMHEKAVELASLF